MACTVPGILWVSTLFEPQVLTLLAVPTTAQSEPSFKNAVASKESGESKRVQANVQDPGFTLNAVEDQKKEETVTCTVSRVNRPRC